MKCRQLQRPFTRHQEKGRLSGITAKTALTHLYFIYCVSHRFYKDMNLFKRLFRKRQPTQQRCSISGSCNHYDEHEQLLIEKVIEMLKTKPECFSARWFTGKSLDKSVRSQNKKILIMIDSGQICHPVEPRMTKEQKELIKQLLEPIVKKDSDYLIEQLVCNDTGL